MDLVIIEGAGKIKKITHILNNIGKNSRVIATCGHIERLKDDQYDRTGISKDLTYNFEWIDGKSKVLKEINEIGSKCNNIYIASDPDREGEGIAWHIFHKLNLQNQKKAKRITFNEISEKAISFAFNQTREIDKNYVNAYLARIALDKKVGYGLSRYLQQTIKLPSAGRVQSVVLKLIAEREKEIENFVPKTIYSIVPEIDGVCLNNSKTYNDLGLYTNHLEKPFTFLQKDQAADYISTYLPKNEFKCFHIGESEIKTTYPSKPYKTSTIQADLIKSLKITSKEAESILQTLYQSGYITYPRTDATRMSEDFCLEAYQYVKEHYPHLANNEFKFNKKGGGAQDAHECIRVVHLDQQLDDNLTDKQVIAYKMIYTQTIIQFMNPVVTEVTKYSFINHKDEFEADSVKVLDQGFNEYLGKEKEDKVVKFALEGIYHCDNYDDMIISSTSKPPAPFSQSSLIKELEKLGIGRPSTYASSVEVNNQRGYTSINKKEILSTTDNGKKAYASLDSQWIELINYTFTKEMEESLDKIAEGKLDYRKYLTDFLNNFEQKLYSVVSISQPSATQTPLNIVGSCPECGKDLIEKTTSTGKKLIECSTRKYNFKTKKTSGCKYQKWINE